MAKGKEDNYKVYLHTFPNNKVYVGITMQKRLNDRWRNGKGYKNSNKVVNAIKKYGWENIKHMVLKTGLTQQEAEDLEIELIKEYKSNDIKYGYNIQNGGFSSGRLSDDIKHKISITKKGTLIGEHNPFYGKTHSKETKKYLSEIRTGTKLSKETRDKIGKSGEKPVIQYNIFGEFIKNWGSAKTAGDSLNIANSSITATCKGKRKTAGGFKWEYGGDNNG